MAWVAPEVIVRRVIEDGMRRLRTNRPAFMEIFGSYLEEDLRRDYGQEYVDHIWDWFSTTKIPVIQSWSFNPQVIPCISIHLGNEQEAEDKLAIDDYAGVFVDEYTTGTAAFTVMLDIGIHANRSSDHLLWLYYIMSYILFKSKPTLTRLGLSMGTFSATDYNKDSEKMGNNIWTRWIRYRCTTQNFWSADRLSTVEELDTDATLNSDGFRVSRVNDPIGEDDLEV